MTESEHRMIEILRILDKQKKPTGSKLIANELKEKGFNLGERAVRYHMQILDEKGYTEKMGYSGRQITDLGRKKLEKGLVYDQVDFIQSKFEEMIYLTDFDYRTKKGNVVVNTSTIYDKEAYDIIMDVFRRGLSASNYINVNPIENRNEYEIKTVCGTTTDGIFLNEGIPSIPLYGGLLKIEDYVPTKFTELISYKKTSIPPLDAFISKGMTSVLDVVNDGNGVIPANFRVVPSVAKEKCETIVKNLKEVGINGVITIGNTGENTLGVPVADGMVGIAIVGGITPFCAAQEEKYNINIKIAEEIGDFSTLKPINNCKPILKAADTSYHEKIPFLLSKSWNLIEEVNFDIEKEKGDIISNVSYVNKEDIDEILDMMGKTYNSNKNYLNPYYKLVPNEKNPSKIGIATICSLSIDGILIKNGIMSNPKYGGLLELTEPPLFVDMISYSGSSLDPHKIFISKNMTSINKNIGPDRILASIKEVPYVARDYTIHLLDILNNIGFSIYKIGKPRELVYNAKVDNYNFGVITGSGLNLIAALKEQNIDVKVKAIEKLIPFEEMEKLWK